MAPLTGEERNELARNYTTDHLPVIGIAPDVESLRSEPRFVELLWRVGLTQREGAAEARREYACGPLYIIWIDQAATAASRIAPATNP